MNKPLSNQPINKKDVGFAHVLLIQKPCRKTETKKGRRHLRALRPWYGYVNLSAYRRTPRMGSTIAPDGKDVLFIHLGHQSVSIQTKSRKVRCQID
jgi:hypothetical protein